MDIDRPLHVLIITALALGIAWLIYKAIKYGGFKAAMFGAPIERTVGEVSGDGAKLMSVALRVHVLGGKAPGKSVGLEFVAKSFASYDMAPFTLTVSEARKLVSLLQEATAGSNAT